MSLIFEPGMLFLWSMAGAQRPHRGTFKASVPITSAPILLVKTAGSGGVLPPQKRKEARMGGGGKVGL